MNAYLFEHLVDLKQIRQLLESHHRLSGMPYGLFDAAEKCLIAVGWKEICVRFHRVHPVSCARCQESDAYIKEHLHDFEGNFLEYRCKNGMIDMAMPVMIDGCHLATFFTGQFFFPDTKPDIGFFTRQAEELGFDRKDYLRALQQVPVFSREHVHNHMSFLRDMVKVLSLCGLKSLKLNLEIEEHRRAEDLLCNRERDLHQMLENAPDPVSRYDLEGRRTFVNPAFEKMMDKSRDLLLGKTPIETPVGGLRSVGLQAQQAIHRVITDGEPTEEELLWKDGGGLERCYQFRFVPEHDRESRISSVLAIARDITPFKTYQQRLHQLAFSDHLTGLPNRAQFLEWLNNAVAKVSASNGNGGASLVLLDLDRFKVVNDSFGHEIGDKVLIEVGRRLRQKAGDRGTVARLGGDEFAIIFHEVYGEKDLAPITETILDSFAEPFNIYGRLLSVTINIGIASCPKDSRDATQLMQLANMALYHAKSLGRNHCQFCSTEIINRTKDRHSLEAALRNALQQHEFELYYQSKIALQTGELTGAEALLRWHHPGQGMITPDRFIGIAEEMGLIVELGEWVVRTACQAASVWNRWGIKLQVAVNLSARQFERNNLVGKIRAILAETDCRPEWLELEITESLLLEERSEVLDMLEELCDMGLSIAIDDFGTGYSALGYLTKFPVNTLKIDKSFVRDVLTSRYNAELIKTIVTLGHALRMDLVAEGVETSGQADHLRSLGCQFAQGYLYSRPVPQKKFEEMLRLGKTIHQEKELWSERRSIPAIAELVTSIAGEESN